LPALVGKVTRAGAVAQLSSQVADLLSLDLLQGVVDGHQLVALESARLARPELRWAGIIGQAHWEAPGALWLQIPRGAFVRVTWSDADVLVHDEGRALRLLLPGSDAALVSPSEGDLWLSAHAPPWLRQAVQTHLATRDPYRVAAAAGLALMHDDPEPAGNFVAELLEGALPPLGPVHTWWHQLPGGTVASVCQLSVAEAVLVYEQIEVLGQQHDVDDEGWCAALTSVLRRRDGLEGVRRLLLRREMAGKLAPVVAVVDRRGTALLADIGALLAVADAWLASARCRDPSAWWASCAVPDEEPDAP
jgi:hypothetical protein